MVRNETRERREKKEGSTDSMTWLKLYSSDEQDRIQRVLSYRERRVFLRKDKSKIKALGGGCISRDRNYRNLREAGARKADKKRGGR